MPGMQRDGDVHQYGGYTYSRVATDALNAKGLRHCGAAGFIEGGGRDGCPECKGIETLLRRSHYEERGVATDALNAKGLRLALRPDLFEDESRDGCPECKGIETPGF